MPSRSVVSLLSSHRSFGMARIVSATGKIVDVLEVAIEIAELEEEKQKRVTT